MENRSKRENKVYYLMNKPKKTLCASSDDRGRQTVIDLMDCEERVFTVGRLDYDTSGALIITNDGEFANQIIHPRYHLPKTYEFNDQRNPYGRRHESLKGRCRIG